MCRFWLGRGYLRSRVDPTLDRHSKTKTGVPFQRRGMTRQKTLDRLLHLRILEEDGKVVGSGSTPTPAAAAAQAQRQGQQQPDKPGARPSPPAASPVAAAVVVNPSPTPPPPPQPQQQRTSTPRNTKGPPPSLSASSASTSASASMPLTRQGSFFNQPSPVFASASSSAASAMRRNNGSSNSLAASASGTHRKVNGNTLRGERPPGLDDIRRSSSVIETSYQTTAVRSMRGVCVRGMDDGSACVTD